MLLFLYLCFCCQKFKNVKYFFCFLFCFLQLEQKYLDDLEETRKIVRVKGQDDVIARDLPLYEQAFRKRNFALKAPPWYKPTVNATINNAKSKCTILY